VAVATFRVELWDRVGPLKEWFVAPPLPAVLLLPVQQPVDLCAFSAYYEPIVPPEPHRVFRMQITLGKSLIYVED